MSLRLDFCSQEAAVYAVRKWYYRAEMPRGRIVRIGVWDAGKFVGVVIFGMGSSADLGTRWGLSCFQCCEMVRLALGPRDDTNAAPTSRIVAIAVKLLKKHSPGIRAIVSFSDPSAGHVGTVYQAMNWVYTGRTNPDKRYIAKDGTEHHSRQVSPKGWKETQGRRYAVPRPQDCRVIKVPGKHRYVYPLDPAMRELLARDAKPYPKEKASEPRRHEVTKEVAQS